MESFLNLNKVIEDFNNLPLEDREYALELIKKQIIEAKREAIAKRTEEANDNLKKGNVKKGNIETLRRDLESD